MEGVGSKIGFVFWSNPDKNIDDYSSSSKDSMLSSYTVAVLVLILIWQLLRRWSCFLRIYSLLVSARDRTAERVTVPRGPTPVSPNLNASSTLSHLLFKSTEISDFDLKYLIDNLDSNLDQDEKWEDVIHKTNNLLSYTAKCCKPKDGPLKYWSVTVFENCSPEMLRDFYMDSEYRKLWDKTLIEHMQLEVDMASGTEIGRTIKKFPLLTPREYILAWRVWEGMNQTFYCYSKECEHPAAPRQKKYVRVAFFRSGWRIRKVPGRNACEIKMLHQEDAGLNVEMAKLAFAKGIWSYVCKMDNALRKYSVSKHTDQVSAMSAVALIHKVPPGLDRLDNMTSTSLAQNCKRSSVCGQAALDSRKRQLTRRPSSKLIANGLILLGGVFCLSRGRSDLGAKVAMAYILSKFAKRSASATENRQVSAL